MAPPKDLPHGFKLLIIWLVVMAALFLAIQAWLHEREASHFRWDGQRVVLRRASDGHFHWPGRVNGRAVDFLVDTGASRTALPLDWALRAGVQPGAAVRANTAGGAAVGQQGRADLALDGGVSIERLPVMLLPNLASPLLGMDVLSQLRFSQGDGELKIEARP